MISNVSGQDLDAAFRRVRDLDVAVAEQLGAFADAGRQCTPDFAAAVDRLVGRVRQYGAGEAAPEPGDPLPPFVLPDDSGRMVSLHELLTQGPVAVTFHRGHWCPYCRININALAQAHREIAAEGGQIVAIMPDLQKFVAEFRSESKVPFPILTDMDNGYALSLNLTIWLGGELAKLVGPRRHLPEFQGSRSWMPPISGTFLVARVCCFRPCFRGPY